MKNTAYIAQSLDGFIAGPSGELDWLETIDNPDHNDFGFSQFMAGVDALLMGKNTFEKIASFDHWPYDKPVFVLSSSLKALDTRFTGKATLVSGTLEQVITLLNRQGFKHLYIDGGRLIQSCLKAGIMDELIITSVPYLLGEGIPLFTHLASPVHLTLLKSEVLVNQLVKNHYKIVNA